MCGGDRRAGWMTSRQKMGVCGIHWDMKGIGKRELVKPILSF